MAIKRFRKSILLWALALLGLGGAGFMAYSVLSDPFTSGKPLMGAADGAPQITLVDENFQMDPLSDGWAHRTFLGTPPTRYSVETIDDRHVVRCETHNAGSILARHTRIDLSAYPIMSWSWKIERPIENSLDEESEEGDDHPARFFLKFEEDDGKKRGAEIIWSNKKYAPGEFKIIGNFYHYVANGLPENAGTWYDQRVNLMQLYKDIGGRAAAPKLTVLGFFCDSDNAGGDSLAYFAKVTLSKN